jgi:hypothetical protein
MSVGSIYFNQSDTLALQYLRGSQNSNLVLNGNFTIEFYIKCTTEPPAQDLKSLIFSQYSGWGAIINSYWIFVDNDTINLGQITILQSGNGTVIISGTTPVNNNVWNHIAIVRNGMGSNNISLFVNGILDATATNTTPWDYSGLNGFCIGTNVLDPNNVRISYTGFISNMRIVNGTAVYTTNFTPSTTNLTAIPGTALLLNTTFNSPFLDSSPNNITITTYNSPTPSNDSPMSVPCFKENTKILVYKNNLEQYIKIQDLRSGDLVKTLNDGYVPINMIGKRYILHSNLNVRDKNGLYKCVQENYPEVFEDLIITGCHSILVDNFLNQDQQNKTIDVLGEIYITDNKYRLPACVDERAMIYEKEGEFTIYHIALDNENYYYNYGIYANGLLVESCSKRYLKELSNMELFFEK